MYHRKYLSVLSFFFFLQGRLNLFGYSFLFWMYILSSNTHFNIKLTCIANCTTIKKINKYYHILMLSYLILSICSLWGWCWGITWFWYGYIGWYTCFLFCSYSSIVINACDKQCTETKLSWKWSTFKSP